MVCLCWSGAFGAVVTTEDPDAPPVSPNQPAIGANPSDGYAVVVSRATLGRADWKNVADALVAKHHGQVLAYDQLSQAQAELTRLRPRYACFVATPAEATRQFVADVHRLTRRLDDDPYTDVLWGILTGYDAACALRIAKCKEPLVIERAAAATDIELALCDEGVWYCELKQGKMVRKAHGQPPEQQTAPADTTKALVDTLNEYHPQLFVTSGHATERDWQIGFAYRNGQFRCEKGRLFGVDTKGQRFPVQSDNPKVYLPVGNCLMGHIDGPDCMALAFMNSAGVNQMIGYTVPTWYGYAGWGMLDYFVEQPGRFTLAEAFFANQQALLHELATKYPKVASSDAPPGEVRDNGLLHDRDVLALYGDPAWEARMKPGDLAWDQTLTEKDDVYTLTITPRHGEKSFQPINTNGSQRGGRPIVAFLPRRIQDVHLREGQDLKPVITENFVLVPLPEKNAPSHDYKVVFQASRVRAVPRIRAQPETAHPAAP
jgi:zinc protease